MNKIEIRCTYETAEEFRGMHDLVAEDNERRLKSRVAAVFPDGVHHLTYHAVMSSERPLPRGSEALQHIEKVARATGAKCIIVDTVQAFLNPSATNKNYDAIWSSEIRNS